MTLKKPWIRKFIYVVISIYFIASFVIYNFHDTRSNHGMGSSKGVCKSYILLLRIESQKQHELSSINQLKPKTHQEILEILDDYHHGYGQFNYYIKEDIINLDKTKKEIFIVCEKAFSKQEGSRIYNGPKYHVVAYNDGYTGLITPEEYKKIDLSKFRKIITQQKE